jgi:hypothetical protein
LERVVDGKFTQLRSFPYPGKQAGQEYTLELAAIGSTIYVKVDSRLFGTVQDSTINSGAAGVIYGRSPGHPKAVVEELKYVALDGLSEANAMKRCELEKP